MSADENVVFFAFCYGFGHDEGVAGVKLSSVLESIDTEQLRVFSYAASYVGMINEWDEFIIRTCFEVPVAFA